MVAVACVQPLLMLRKLRPDGSKSGAVDIKQSQLAGEAVLHATDEAWGLRRRRSSCSATRATSRAEKCAKSSWSSRGGPCDRGSPVLGPPVIPVLCLARKTPRRQASRAVVLRNTPGAPLWMLHHVCVKELAVAMTGGRYEWRMREPV